MRRLLLLLACGCTVADPFAASDPDESEVVSLSVIEPCPAAQWCVEPPPPSVAPTITLRAVWAIDEDDVFAVGDAGTILRRVNNTDWYPMQSGTTSNLLGVWGSSSSDVWAGGASSTLLHYDGTSWSQVSTQIPNVDSIWGSGPSDVWFVGSTRVLHWNGSGLANAASFTGPLLAVSGSGPNDVWVTGANTYMHHYNGTSWSLVFPGAGSTYFAVFARTATEVWAGSVTPGKETTRWNGINWTPYKADARVFFHSIAGEAANDLWAAGNSLVGHWTGGPTWTTEHPFGDGVLLSVTTVPGHLWVVGDGALIAHRAL